MDKNQIITLAVNAVITIVTTAVVVRLSLNKGRLGLTTKMKAAFTPKVAIYTSLFIMFLFAGGSTWALSALVRRPDPPTRRDVFQIVMSFATSIYWWHLALKSLATQIRQSREEREKLDEVK